jgi:uncharacterized membrane protein YccC
LRVEHRFGEDPAMPGGGVFPARARRRRDARRGARVREALKWRPSDPGHFALRLAIRTGVALPVALALGTWTGNEQTALFAAFGCFATLLFVDFGGPRSVRLGAYLTLGVVCSALIALGTLCSRHAIAAAVVMFLVGFAVLFSGVLNGYIAAAASGTLLTFILPAMVPADAGDIGARLAGWWIALAVSIPATFVLFPARPRDRLRAAVAEAGRALAAYVRDATPEHEHPMSAALDELHERFASTPFRPTGPTGATGALAAMIDELDWLRGLVLRPASSGATLDPTPGELALRETSAQALLASAALVEGRSMQAPDRAAVAQGRERALEELIAQLEDPAVRDDDGRLASALARAWDVRVISYLTLELADRAVLAGGGTPDADGPRWLRFVRRQGVALAASGRLAVAHAGGGSVWFRNSLRGAIGLAIAVLIASEASVQHAFWVALGSLSVLRSSALNTGASIVQALLGTVVGIVAGGLLLVAIGSSDLWLWIVLPFAAMLAAYAPRAVSFAAGQAGFTVAVFVIFDLIAGAGWQVGLVRLQDVSLGFAISLLVGLLFWPRGAATVLRRSTAEALATSARYAEAAVDRLVTAAPAAPAAHRAIEAVGAEGRLDVAFRQRLSERQSDDMALVPVTRLISAATRLRGTGDALLTLADRIGDTPRPAAAHALVTNAHSLSGWYGALSGSVADRRAPPAPAPIDSALRPALLAAVREAAAAGSRDQLVGGTSVAWSALHLAYLERLEDRCAAAAADLASS